MASIAALPVLIGLAVDYAIQFQARYDEARARSGATPGARPRGGRGGRRADDRHRRARHGGGLPRAAAVAGADGARLRRAAGGRHRAGARLRAQRRLRGAGALRRRRRRAADCRGARSRARSRRSASTRACSAAREWLADRSWRTLGVALVAPAAGAGDRAGRGGASGWRSTRRPRWSPTCASSCPQDLQALRGREHPPGGDRRVGRDRRDGPRRRHHRPGGDRLDDAFQEQVLRAHGYRPASAARRSKNPPELCPALSLPDLFRTAGDGSRPRCARLLDAVPAYFSQGVVTPDRKTANLAFGIRLMPLDRQKDGGRRHQGAAEAARRASRRRWSACRCWPPRPTARCRRRGAARSRCSPALAGVFLVLLVARRSAREAAVPLIPIALATGWSGARAVRARPAAGPARGGPQPDVGHARRARDRDLDRVQRAAVGALPPGARRRRRARRGRSSWPTRPPARRCWPRASPRSPASPRWSSPTSACCATSGS